MTRPCEICGKPIPAERLAALPQTRRCVKCAATVCTDLITARRTVGMDIETYKDLLSATRS